MDAPRFPIVLAKLFLDERLARRTAAGLALKVTGVVGVLLRACGGCPRGFRKALDDLQDRAGFFLAAPLRDELLEALEDPE